MRAVVTRVASASVTIAGKVVGEIGRGFLVLLGVGPNDTEETADRLAEKICNLRVFEDENGKMNLNLEQTGGALLVVSQFTLYADTKSRRPGFTGAAKPDVRYFDYAFSRIPGFEKERALLIGDSLTSDMLGAQNAGIDSMWYCPQALRYYPEWEEEAKKLSITYQVGSFEEMRRVLL